MATGVIDCTADEPHHSIDPATPSDPSSSANRPHLNIPTKCNCAHPKMLISGRPSDGEAHLSDSSLIAERGNVTSGRVVGALPQGVVQADQQQQQQTPKQQPLQQRQLHSTSSAASLASLTGQSARHNDHRAIIKQHSTASLDSCSLPANKPPPHQHHHHHQQQQQQNARRRSSVGGAGWMKLRSTVHMASAIQRQRKRRREASRLSRQDSFLVKFSTRYHGASNSSMLSEMVRERQTGSGTSEGVSRRQSVDDVKIVGDRCTVDVSIEEDETLCPPHARFINADGAFMFYWLGAVTFALLFNVWTNIAREGFPELRQGHDALWFTLDAICDAIYLADIVIQFRTGYLENGLVVYDSRKLARNYCWSRSFCLDLLCLTPLDLLQYYVGIHPLLRFPRYLKVHRALKFAYMVETRTAFPNVWRVANLSHILFLGSHWFAVFYYMISKSQGFIGGWGYPPPVGENASVTRKYLKSLHWSMLTLTTIGDLPPPGTDWEYVYYDLPSKISI